MSICASIQAKVLDDIKPFRLVCSRKKHTEFSLTLKLEANFRPPEFMIVAFIGLYGGSEEIVARGMTKEALDKFIEANNLRSHSRLRRLTITGPDGIVEQTPKE